MYLEGVLFNVPEWICLGFILQQEEGVRKGMKGTSWIEVSWLEGGDLKEL